MDRFLDPKFKTFSRVFQKQYFIFLDSRLPNRWSIGTLKNAGTQAFFMMYWKCMVTKAQCGHRRVKKFLILWLNSWLRTRLNEILLREKIHLLSTCCSFEKKTRIFTIFPVFFQVWKVALQTYDFSRIQDGTNPVYRTVKKHYTRAYSSSVYF